MSAARGWPAAAMVAFAIVACGLDRAGTANYFAGDAALDAGIEDAFVDPDTSCPVGYARCGSNVGCDTIVGVDGKNCGVCGHVCGATNASPSCVGGVCNLACKAGFASCDKDDANGCETTTGTDPKNCGACGHDCLGATCSAGVCQPSVLAQGQAVPYAIAVDANNVFWTNRGTTDGTGALIRAGLDGAGATAIASTLKAPAMIALAGAVVYWTNIGTSAGGYYDGNLMRIGKDGSCTFAPCPFIVVDNQTGPIGVASDGVEVFYITTVFNQSVYQTYIAGGSNHASFGEPGAILVAADANGAYWTNRGTGAMAFTDGAVRHASYTLAGPSSLYTGNGIPFGIAIDAADVYFTNSREGTVMRVPRVGGPPVTLAKDEQTPAHLVVDANDVYWASQGTAANTFTDGSIVKVAKKGCATPPCQHVLATNQNLPNGIAVDAKYVYWVNLNGGTVMRVPK